MVVRVVHGKMEDVLRALEAESFDAVATDPPYHLHSITKRFANSPRSEATENGAPPYGRTGRGFMGKEWDGGDVAFRPETWAAVLRVLKPGGFIAAFGSSRGYGRMQVAMEDAGFWTHPMCGWIFAQGFPKAHDFTRQFDEKLLGFTREDDEKDWEMSRSHFAAYWGGHRTGRQAMKPALEPIYIGQKPFSEGTGHENVWAHGCGALNIDAGRVGVEAVSTHSRGTNGAFPKRPGERSAEESGRKKDQRDGLDHSERIGRWPANLAHDGSEEVLAAFGRFSAPRQLGPISTTAPSEKTSSVYGRMRREGEASADRRYTANGSTNFAALPGQRREDVGGSPARFFKSCPWEEGERFWFGGKARSDERIGNHPTVKPVALMEWLCSMICPPNGRILDPFCGTGSTLVACDRLGFDAVGIEQDEQTCRDAEAKIKRMRARRMLGDAGKAEVVAGQMELGV